MAWIEFLFAFIVFLVSHMVPARTGLKGWFVQTLGLKLYMGIYSLISLGLFYWLIRAAQKAPYIEVWPLTQSGIWLANFAMALACGLFVFGIGIPNPFSLGGYKSDQYDPQNPRIVGITRHPLFWAIILWALTHIIVNGSLAYLILFGIFGAMAIMGMWVFEKRARRLLGERYHTLSANSSKLLFAKGFKHLKKPSLKRLLMAVLLFVVLHGLHPIVIGVSPL